MTNSNNKMTFNKVGSVYQATRFDGQVITIEQADCEEELWLVTYEGDFCGDNSDNFQTKRKAINCENRIAARM